MKETCGPSGETLLVIALLVSIQLAEGRTSSELATWSAFLNLVSSNLALISIRRAPLEAAAEASNPAAAAAGLQQ